MKALTHRPFDPRRATMNTASTSTDPFVGATVLENYRVTAHVRREPRGECYQARSLREGENVLLRFMSRAVFAPGPAATWGPLWAYAERLQRLDHPNLERVLECGMARMLNEEQFCVVSDALEGDTLLAHVRAVGPLPVADALTLGRQIAQGMAALHRLHVVHGDLRATNIILVRSASNDGADACPVVCELGLTSLALRSQQITASLRAMLVSPESIAPEQIRGEVATPATDIYAFGTVLYRMLTGAAAFGGDNTSQTLRAHLTRSVPPLAMHCDNVPDSVEALVRKCMARRPEDRFPSFEALLATLQQCEATVLSIASNRSPSWVSLTAPTTVFEASASRADAPRDPAHAAFDALEAAAEAAREASEAQPSNAPAESVAPATAAPASPSVSPANRRKLHIAAAITLGFGCVFGFVASAMRASRHAAPTAQTASLAADAPRRAVRFEVRSQTHNAQATIRGRTYPAPIEIELGPGTDPEMVEVSAPGHVTRRVWMVLDRTMRVQLDLDPEAPAAH